MYVRRIAIASVVAAGLLGGCSSGAPAPPARAARVSTPEPSREPENWRKPRYVPVREAVERLARHVDVPVVLPRDRLAGLTSYRRWLADPKHVTWDRPGREGSGVLGGVDGDGAPRATRARPRLLSHGR